MMVYTLHRWRNSGCNGKGMPVRLLPYTIGYMRGTIPCGPIFHCLAL